MKTQKLLPLAIASLFLIGGSALHAQASASSSYPNAAAFAEHARALRDQQQRALEAAAVPSPERVPITFFEKDGDIYWTHLDQQKAKPSLVTERLPDSLRAWSGPVPHHTKPFIFNGLIYLAIPL